MISMFVNCAKAWSRLVQTFYRVTRRPQITLDRPVPPTGAVRP
jgi:hypothetical protein